MYREAGEGYKEGPLDSAVIWNKIGIAYHQMMQMDEARRNYEKALKLKPKYAEAINNLGTVYYARRRFRRPIGLYNKALKLTPKSPSTYSNLRPAHIPRRKHKEASKAYQQPL